MNNNMENSEVTYVPIYKSYIKAIEKLNPEDRLIIYEAIFNFGFTGEEPVFDNPYLEMGWQLVKPNLENNIARIKRNQKNGKKNVAKKKQDTTSTKEVLNEVGKVTSNEVKTKSDINTPQENKSSLEVIKRNKNKIKKQDEMLFEENKSYKDIVNEINNG